jgi:hypothetical protein
MKYQTINDLPAHQLRELENRISARVSIPQRGDCHEWQGALTYNGYGRIGVNGKVQRVHRVAYELAHGPIPEGIVVCHRCDNPRCCNPDHLFLGTTQENVDDKVQKGRHKPFTSDRVIGEKNPRALLTAADVTKIRKRYTTSGVTLKQLASEYGVHFDTISKAVNRVTWSHL